MLAFFDALSLFQLISYFFIQPLVKWLKVKGDLPASILDIFNLHDRRLNHPNVLVDVASCMGFRFFIPQRTDSYTRHKPNNLSRVGATAQPQHIKQ